MKIKNEGGRYAVNAFFGISLCLFIRTKLKLLKPLTFSFYYVIIKKDFIGAAL